MSVTYGFYNSLNGDRKYDTVQLSRLFDGLIIDGIFASIGTCFMVKADTGLTVNIGIGKAWFNQTWTLNDTILPMEAPISALLLDRIDALVIEVDASEAIRANSIKFVQGTASSSPINPTLASETNKHQYPLCYIYRSAGSTEITQADITNMVGSEATPFVTGILQTINLSELLGQWEDQLEQFVASEQADFLTWFDQMRGQLSTDAAGRLQNQITMLNTTTAKKPTPKTIILTPTWSGTTAPYTQTVAVQGVTATNLIMVSPDATQTTTAYRQYSDNGVYCKSQAENQLVFIAESIPTVAIQVIVVIGEVA